MAGRSANISVSVRGEADFDSARREAKRALDQIEGAADDAADGIKRAFDNLSPELDTTEIRKALDLADQLDGMVASFTVDTDISEIQEAEKLAKALRGFQARVDLSVEGREELKDALGLAEKVEGIRKVKVEVQGRQDLERAQEIADDLEKRRTVQVDVDDSELSRAGDKLEASLDDAGEAGADSIADHLGDIDFENIGASGLDQLTGALGAVGPWGAVAASIGALFGDSLLEGFFNGWTSGRNDVVRQIRRTLTDQEIADIGEAAGELWRSGFGESLSQLKDVAALITDELADVDAAIDGTFNLDEATKSALTLSEVFEVDLTDSVNAVGKLLSSGLVESSEDGFAAIFDLAQLTGTQFDEALEVVTEFSSALASLGIDGAQGIDLIGQAIEMQLFPQVDQAGEVFEEFNEIIRTGGAAEALAEIGLSAQEMQGFLADGRGAEAMSLIAGILLDLDDRALAAALAAEIFGGNMALVSDPDIALQLLAQADGLREVGSGIKDANKELEAANPNLDQFKRGLSEGAADGASALNDALGVLSEGIVDWVDKMTGGALATEEFVGGAEDLATAAREGTPALEEITDGAAELAGEMVGATQSVEDFRAEIEGLFNFTPDQLFREIADAGRELAEQLDADAAAAVGFQGAIDVSTEAGSKLQAKMEDLNGTLVDAAIANANGELSSLDLARAQDELNRQFEQVASQAGLTTDQVEGLRQKYLSLPADVITTLSVIDNSTAVVKNLQSELAKLKDKTITVTTRNTIIAATAASTQVRERARGGWTDGLTLVGEEGPELIDVRGRAFVHTAAETRELLSNRGGALAAPAVAGVAAGPRVNIEQLVVDKGVDLWQALDVAELVYGGRR